MLRLHLVSLSLLKTCTALLMVFQLFTSHLSRASSHNPLYDEKANNKVMYWFDTLCYGFNTSNHDDSNDNIINTSVVANEFKTVSNQ